MRRCFLVLLSCLLSGLAFGAGKPNIVLITLDSTRADRMGFLGEKGNRTPNLDGVARQSIIFERAYAQAPSSLVSHASILSGTYPQTSHVTRLGSPLPAGVPYLPALLHDRGYRTAAFVGSIELDPWHGPATGFDRGFDRYNAPFHLPQAGENRYRSVERRASQVVAEATAWLAQNTQHQFFLWIHVNDPHAPQEAQPSSPGRVSHYDREISNADAEIGKLLSFLRTHKIYDNALIVVTASQGESLGAHGEDTHGVFLYDETIHVPLLLKLPENRMAAKRVTGGVRLVDVAPTVLEAAGIPIPSQMEGQSLQRVAKTNADLPVYAGSQYPRWAFGWSELQSWRSGKFLFVRAPRPELYDLNADPGATRNLAQTSKATLDTLAAQLDGFVRHFSEEGRGKNELSSAEMQKLASLGYVGLQKSASANAGATGTDPKDVIATANRAEEARFAIENGQPEKAITTLQVLIAAQPNMYLPQYLLGVAEARLHRYPEAIAHLRKAIELQPDSAWAHYEMGSSLLQNKDFKSAATYLEIAAAHLPQFVEAHTALAQAYDRIAKAEDAKRERSRAAQLTRDQSR